MEKLPELLKEKMPHGNAMFPLMVHEFCTDPSITERLACHWHKEFEILVITKGEGQFHIDDQTLSIEEGGILIIPSDCLHSMIAQKDTPLDFFAIVFHPDLIRSHISDTIQQKYIDILNTNSLLFPQYILPKETWEKQLYSKLCYIRTLFATCEMGYELLIKASLYEIWYLLYIHANQNLKNNKPLTDYKITQTKSIILWIEAHYTQQITLSKLTEIFHISEGQLCRLFKSMTKMSIMEYINYYRISSSISALCSTDKQISEIALDSGFHNISYYNKVFKYYMHTTPNAYRKAHQIK